MLTCCLLVVVVVVVVYLLLLLLLLFTCCLLVVVVVVYLLFLLLTCCLLVVVVVVVYLLFTCCCCCCLLVVYLLLLLFTCCCCLQMVTIRKINCRVKKDIQVNVWDFEDMVNKNVSTYHTIVCEYVCIFDTFCLSAALSGRIPLLQHLLHNRGHCCLQETGCELYKPTH